MLVSYHELRGLSPAKARDIVVKVLKQNQGNVARTAAILGICRRTVRRARDGALHDRSRRPACSPRKTPLTFEKLIITEAKRTHFRYRRLAAYLHRKFSLSFSEHTIKAILKRNRVARVTRKSASGERRHLYDYESLTPFAEYQLDTKHLLDQHALPAGVYDHMYQKGLPRFEWHLMEVATRTRFTAYSYELSAAFCSSSSWHSRGCVPITCVRRSGSAVTTATSFAREVKKSLPTGTGSSNPSGPCSIPSRPEPST